MEKGHLISRFLTGAETPDLSAFNPILETFQHLKDAAPAIAVLITLVLAGGVAYAAGRSFMNALNRNIYNGSTQRLRQSQEPLFIKGKGHRREFGD